MNLEDQCVSLELAKKLKELGVKQKSLFYWIRAQTSENVEAYGLTYIALMFDERENFKEIYSAFTCAELLDILPAVINIKINQPFNHFWLEIKKRSAENIKYIASYVCDTMNSDDSSNPLFKMPSIFKAHSPKLADCLAEILINLIEEGLIEVPSE